MKKVRLVLCLVCLLSWAALAQVKVEIQWKCNKTSNQPSIEVGDKPGHAYAVDQINCTATKGEIEGVKIKSGVGTEFIEIKGDKFSGHGEFVQTMDNGTRISTPIAEVGPSKTVKIPPGAMVVDASGKFLIPARTGIACSGWAGSGPSISGPAATICGPNIGKSRSAL
jgi:hypothetical protein